MLVIRSSKWRKGKVDGSDGPARLHRRVLAINHSYIPPFGEMPLMIDKQIKK